MVLAITHNNQYADLHNDMEYEVADTIGTEYVLLADKGKRRYKTSNFYYEYRGKRITLQEMYMRISIQNAKG